MIVELPTRRPHARWACVVCLAAWAAPIQAAFAGEPASRLLVVDRDGSALVVVDPEAAKVVARIATGEGPHEVLALSDRRRAVVANYGTAQAPGDSLSLVDLDALKESRRIPIGALRRPHGLVEVDGKVYFTAEMNRALGRIDPDSGEVDRIVGLGQDGTHMIEAAPGGKTLYTANIGSGTVSVLRRDDGRLFQVPACKQPKGLAVSPDGKEVWAGSRISGEVAILDAASNKVVETIDVGCPAYRLRFTPDGKDVLIPDPTGDRLVIVEAATRKVASEIGVGKGPVGVLVDPSGRFAYVPLAGEGRVAVVDLDGRKVSSHIETGRISDGMSWVEPGDRSSK
jgi:YVTN family beta-propeller protein